MAADTRHVFRPVLIRFSDRPTTGEALVVIAWDKTMTDRHAAIKDETLALPFALFGGDVFEIFQDAALQVEDVINTERFGISGRFLAADPAGAEHGNLGLAVLCAEFLEPVRELAEGFGFRD